MTDGVAEEELANIQAALCFISAEGSASRIEALELDLFGNISNWPENFFGDEMGDLVVMAEAAMARHNGDS